MKKFHKYKKWLLVGTILLLLAPVGITPTHTTQSSSINSLSLNLNVAMAQTPPPPPPAGNPAKPNAATAPSTPNFFSCVASTSLATCSVYFVAYAANTIITLFVTLGAWLVGLALQFNNNIFSSPAIQVGFSVSLAIANLGFVLGIIIIALATIIRNETYGIKQLLWKLVVMALLVNFGLVIMAPIVGFADSMSTYFINATSPSAATGGYSAYVNTMTQAFAPQGLTFDPPATDATAANSATTARCANAISSWLCKYVTKALQTMTPSDNFIQMILAMVFGVVFTSLTAITFLLLAILLIVRYLMLGGLLIILPLAWLMWIFPKFSSNFSKWWDTFIKWTFFPPLALFFIYLAFLTAANTGSSTSNAYLNNINQYAVNNNEQAKGIATETGLVSPINQVADEILLVGLTVMGLMFAHSLSGKAGATAVHGATTASRAVGGYVGRKTKRWGGDRLRTTGRKYNPETKEWTTLGQRIGSKMQGVPLVRHAGTVLANVSAPKAVQKEREEDVKSYISHNLANLDANGLRKLANATTAFVNPTHAAAMAQELAKRDMITELKEKQEKYLGYAEKMGTAEAVYANRPDLMKPRMIAGKPGKPAIPANPATGALAVPAVAAVPDRMETKEEAIARAIKEAKGDVINTNYEVFNYADPDTAAKKLGMDPSTAKDQIRSAVLQLSGSQLGAIGSDTSSTSKARQLNLTNAIRTMLVDEYSLRSATVNAKTGEYEIDKVRYDALVDAAKKSGNKKEQEKLESMKRIYTYMKGNINFGNVLD